MFQRLKIRLAYILHLFHNPVTASPSHVRGRIIVATFRQLYTYRVTLNGKWIATKTSRTAAEKIQAQHPGATIEAIKGNVQAYIRKAGYKPISDTFPTKRQAQHWAGIQEGNMNSGHFKNPLVYTRMTIETLLQRYEAQFTSAKQSARQERTSLKNIYRLLGDKLLPLNGQRKGELTRKDVRDYVMTRRREGVLSETIRKELNPLSNCLNIASDAWEDVPDLENVVQKAKPILKLTKELLPGNKRTRRIWQEEIDIILGPGLRSFYAPLAFKWAYNTGMRRSEACQALMFETWFDVVDPAGRVVNTTRAYLKALDYIEEHKGQVLKLVPRPDPKKKYLNRQARTIYLPAECTKTDRERYVYLTDEALEVLDKLPPSTDGRLFNIMPDTLTNWLDRRTTAKGITDLRWHDARHEALTRFAEMRWGIEKISASSGHEDWESLKRYLHPSMLAVVRDPVTGRVVSPEKSSGTSPLGASRPSTPEHQRQS
jgi:integrase